MPKYRVNGDIYNIPDDKAAAFEKRYPNATVDIYDNDGEEYTLPVSEKAGFQEQFKNWSYSAPSVPSAPSAPSSKKIDTGENLGPVMPTPEAKDADGNIDWRETARQELEKSVPEAARPNSSKVQVPERPEATTAQGTATASAGEYVNAPIAEDKQEVSLQQANREQVADLSSRIDDMLNQAQTASRDIYVQEQEEARKGGVLSTIAKAIAASGHNPEGKMDGMSDAQQQTLKGATPELQQDIATLEAAKRAMSNAQDVIAEADKSAQEGKFDGFIKGVARGFGDKFFDVHTWDMGVSDTKESAELLRVLTKFDKGEPLSESEQMLLDAKSVELATNAYFGSYIGRGYKAGSVTAQSLPFMIEMAINPASTVGESAQSMLARYAMRRFGKKAIAKAAGIAGRAVGDIAGSAIMAGTTGSIHVAGDAIDRSTGDIKTDVDDGGRTVFVGHEDGESLGKAIAKAFTATAIENHSEMLGEYFSPVLGTLGAAGRKVMNKVGLEKAVQFVDDVKASDLAKLINDFQKQTKWNGTIGEYAEEVAGNIENAILVGDQTLDTDSDTGVFNLSQNIDTFLGVSLMGGAFSVVRTAGYRTPKYRARKDMIKARDKAAELYGEERWKDIEDGLANAGDEGITEYLTDAILNETDPGKKAALLDYAGKIKAYEGTLKGNEKHREISGPEMTDLETSYENGYTLATPQEVNDAKMMFEYQQQRLRDNLNLDDIDIDDVLFGNEMGSLTDEQKSVAMDYLNAKATYDGVLDHVRDDLDTRVAAVTNAIDSHVNVDNGQIVTATLKQDDRKVYIIGGNVVMTPDGTMVDSQKSEKYIIIKDAETGQISSVDPTQILRLDGNLDPVKEKENARQQIMQTLARQEADKIDGVLPFNQGDTYQLTAEDGQSFPVQVVANEQGVIDNGDGTVNVVLNNDIDSTTGQPRITQMAKEQIQSMAEATNIARLQQHELQKAEERMRAAEEERTSRTQGAPYHINDRITITDAKTGELLNAEIVSEITDDGKYEVEVNTGDGEIVMMYLSPEELSQMNAQLVSAKIIDAEPEMVAQEQPEIAQSSTEIEQETALSRIPVDKNGDAQFEEAQPSDTWKALVEMNEGDAAEAEDTAKQMFDNATKELDKAQKAKPKAGATVMEIQKNKAEYKSKLDKLQARVDYWGKVLSFPEAERKPAAIAAENAKTEAMQQANDNLAKGRKIMQEKGTYYKEDSKLGDYLNFEDFALRMIANGRVKFVWKSDPNNSAIKGLGAHLGFEDNENERKRVFSILANADKGGLRPDEAAQELAEIYNSSNDNESIDTMQALDTILDIIRSYGGKTRDMMNAAIAAHADVGMDERGSMEDRQGNPINPDGTLYAESVSSIDEITDEDFTEPTRNIALPKIPENVDNAIGANGKPIIIKKNIFKRNSQVHPEVSPQQAREILSSALYRPDLYGQNQKTSRPYNWIVISTKDSVGQNRLVVLEVNENKDNVEIIHWYNARNSSIEQIKRQAQKEGGLILILPSETEEAGGLSSRQSGLSSEGKDTNISEESNIESEKPVTEQITEQRKVVNTEPTETKKNEGAFGLVSDDRMAELKERLRKKLGGQLNMGIDPEILAIGMELAVGHIDRGIKTFADFSKKMIEDLGDVIRPYLKAFYNGARDLPEVIESGLSAEMTPYDEVRQFNVATIGENGVEKKPTVLETAEQVSNELTVQRNADEVEVVVSETENTTNDAYSIAPAQYTTKRGKVLDMFLVKPNDELGTSEHRDANARAREMKGWWDKKAGGFMLRSEEDARQFAEQTFRNPIGTTSSANEVQAVDVANFDKETTNIISTVEMVEKEAEVEQQAKVGAEKLHRARNIADKTVTDSEKKARRAFSRAIATEMIEAVSTGVRPFDSIVNLRKLAEKCGMTLDKLGSSDILLQELVEDGLVTAARDIIESKRYGGSKSREAYNAIVQLYEMQPTISQRSSTRIKMQQYSTPLPMAFVADMFAFHPGRTGFVLEPTAGNGMLVFAIPAERVHANELDETRLANLREQGFREVTSQDGALPFEGEYDAVIANPPFGSAEAKEYDGVSISGLDPQIALNALASMSDTGKAAIIVGGNLEYASNGALKGGKKAFFSYLYDHYNVRGIIDMSGDLYKRQGTTFPTMMILIDGRRSEAERAQTKVYPPVKSAAIGKVNNFEELYDTVISLLSSNRKTNGYETVRTQELGLFDNNGPSGTTSPDGPRMEHNENDSDVRRGTERTRSDRPSERNGNGGIQRTEKQSGGRTDRLGHAEVSGQEGRPDRTRTVPDRGSSDRGGRNSDVREEGERISDVGTGQLELEGVPSVGTSGTGVGITEPVKKSKEKPKEERKLTDEKLHYVQHSSAFSLESVAPAAMVEAMDATLANIEDKYGKSIDEFVTDELGYDSITAMHNALAAEQVDSVAMAIDQMKQGQALVIGDQTGVGKGRQMAALIRWAVRQGTQPIFITQKATLFTDIYRDLVDIGSGDLNPFIFNAVETSKDSETGETVYGGGVMKDGNGVLVHRAPTSAKLSKIFKSGELPAEYDFAVLTYSQVNTGDEASAMEAYNEKKKNGARAAKPKNIRSNPKADFLRKIAKDNYLFLDESHTAAGDSKSGYYLQSLVKDAAAVTFASATFAKRPDTMPLYALRTAMSKAQLGEGKSLIGIIKRGGVTLQEIMSRALTAAGQMVRRERDMSDVRTDWETVTDPKTVEKARENYDKTIEAFNDIIEFQSKYVTPLIDALSSGLALMGSQAKHKKGTKKMGIDNVPFASKTYNYTKQLMLALKTDAIIDRVAKEIQEGRHPVIALESTMEGLLKDSYMPGDVVENPTFAASLLRGLDTVLQYTVTDENGKETHRSYSPSELGEEGARAYYELRDKIIEATSDIYISPLDAIINGLKERGFKVGELTGRTLCAEIDAEGRTVVRKRTDTDKLKMMQDFNSGALDVLVLNKSASTGISLHASKKFKDQRQRSMIIAQPLSDINDYMQMIGRIDRTGQVHRGYYINLALPVPAEQRFNMMLSTKLKSLNANTTTSQDSESNSVDAPDLLNKYGSQVVVEYLRDNPAIYTKLGCPLKDGKGQVRAVDLDEYKPSEDDARKITGYVALLSTKEQQDFYDDVIRRYNDLINYLNETGTNDLKITVMPLEAKTVEKSVSSEGAEPDGDNPFAQHAFVEKVEMNVLSKPMSADEIRKTIKKLNGDKAGTERRTEILNRLREESQARLNAEDERYEAAKAKGEEDIAKRTAVIMAKEKMSDEEKKQAIDRFTETIHEKIETTHEDNHKKIIASANSLMRRMMSFDVEKTYMIADNLGNGGQSLFCSPAIFCGFKSKESKITASTTIAVFAPLDGRRRIEVKMSDMTACNQIIDLTELNYQTAAETTLSNWDSQIPNETRKTGYILTGNILQAIADTSDEYGNYTGQLVSFTDDEGNVRDGILMPDQWTPALLPSAGVPINARAADIMKGRSFSSTDGSISIQTGYFRSAGEPMYFELSVPKSKAKGGKYFLNDELLSLLHGEFRTRSGKMQATIWPDNIKAVLDLLSRMGVRVADSPRGQEDSRRFRDGYHGSIANFDAFDISHAGEGEGFQSHGFGHYIAFNKETAESYAWNNAFEHLDKEGLLSPELSEIMRSDEFDTYEQMVERYDSLLKEKQKDAEDELELSKLEDAGDTSLINMMKRDFDRWMSYKPLSELLEDTRYLYTVNIPDDNGHNYIDEMRTLDKSDRKRIADVLRSLPESRLQKATHGPTWLRDGFNTLANVIEREQYAGLEIRRRLVDALGSEKQASEILSKAGFVGYKYNGRADGDCAVIFSNDDISINHKERFRIREDEPPTKTGIGYKVFVLKNGQLYPPMVANPNGESTPVGIWLDADAAPVAGTSKTGRPKVKAGGRGTQGGSGTLAYRPGWHLGVIPYALQFNRKGESGERELFPANFVWAEVEYANDVDYQDEAMSYGYNESGKFQHSLAGLPRVPENGAYTYRTNPDPKTDPWIITGAMKVNRLLTPSEVDEMVRASGREPQKRQKGAVTDEQIQTLNRNIEAISSTEPSDIRESISELAGRLGENIRIVEDVNELTDSNPKVQRRMRNSFGWYDTETGEIVVVLPNARSVADARATILHEAVGHKGLRELVGDDRFDDFLDKVYAAASLETRKKIVDLAKQNHWNFRLSTEEYIAGLSETGFSGRENRTWFGKIKDFFLDMLSRAKIALGFNIGDNELRYMLWRTYQMRTSRGILAKANDMAIQQELKVGNFREDQLRGRNGFTENDIAEMETPILESRGTFAKLADAEKWAKENLQGKTFVNSFTGDKINISGHSIKEMLAPKFSKAINEKTHMAAIMSVPDFIETGIPAEIHKDTHGRGYDVMRLYNAIVIDGELYRVKSTVKRYVDGDRYYTYEIQEMELLKGTQTTALGLDDSSRPQLQSSITGANLLKGVKKTNFDEEILSDNDSRFRFRSSGNGVSSNKARDIYEEKTRVIDKNGRKSDTANLMRRLKEAYVDSMQSLKYLQDAISEETGKPVEDFENAYLAENSMSSKNKAQTDIFLTRFFNPIKDAVRELQKEGEDYGDIVRYLMAKHGLERNEVFSKRDAEKDGGVWDGSVRRDYSGLTELTQLDSDTKTPGIGEITSRAERIVGDFEKAHNVDALWDTINKATKETLHTAYVSGKMTKENYNYVRSMFKYYIPLRGWKEDNASAVYDYLSEVRPRTTSIVKAATGRTSISDDPIATIAYMGQNAIIQGNRELMKQKLLNLAINHKTSLLTVSRQWEVMDPVTGVWEERNPIIPVDATAEQIADILSTFEKDMKEAENNGLARISRGSLDTGKHVTQYEGQEHVVRVMRGGVHYCIYVNGNPRAAQAVNGMTNPDAADSWLIRRARTVKNFMARMFTSQNPAFIVTNLSRDLIFAGTAVFAKEDGKYASLYTKNITAALAKGQMLKLIYKFEHDTLDDNIPLEKYFKEFIKNGGETGFTQLNTVDDFKRDIDRFASEMTQGQVKKVTTKIWNGIWDSVEFMNRCAEDATRFSVYMTSRQMGRSIEKSISDAKEVTVNFNRKGSGTYGARAMNFAYIFFNAAVQSLANAGKILYEHPVKATAALMTFSAAGFVAPLLAQAIIAAFGGDDDSYWDLPEWVRRNNFVFYIPWSKNKFLIIPISQELRPFYALGEIAMSVLMGKEEALDGLKSAAGSFMDLLPVDFMGNGGNLAVSLTPTVAQPFAQLVANTDYFGKPIYRRNDWNEKDPGWTKAYKGTNSMLVDATKWLNEVSGGDNVVKGWIDVNPAVVEHLYESYLGGVGKTLNKTVKTLSMIWDPDSRVVRNVPIVSTFIQDADDERTAGSQLNREYNELMREFDKTDHKVKGYKKQIRLGAMEYADKLNEFMDTPEFQRYSSLYGYVSAIRKIKSAIKYSPDEDVETLKQSLNDLKSQMVEEMENMQDGNR